MTYRSYLFDNSYLLGADLKKRSDSAIIKVRSIENEISLSPLKDNINNYNGTSFNLKPIFWGTVHFGADNYFRSGDINHSVEKVGLHQELLRVNRFQMESHPKNALFPDNVFNLSKKVGTFSRKKKNLLLLKEKKLFQFMRIIRITNLTFIKTILMAKVKIMIIFTKTNKKSMIV